MPSRAGATLTARYQAASRGQLERLAEAVGGIYGDEIDPDDIEVSAARVASRVAPVVTAGQRAQQVLAAGFYRALGITETGRVLEPLPLVEIAGTRLGQSLSEGMAPLGSMMLGTIAQGQTPEQAIEYGRYLFERFADATARQAADTEKANQEQRPEITGWEGIVDPNSCDLCLANEGVHDLADAMYRHGNCLCERLPVYGAGGP